MALKGRGESFDGGWAQFASSARLITIANVAHRSAGHGGGPQAPQSR